MRVESASAAEVLRPLPGLLARELSTPEVAGLVDELVRAGWRPGQLAHRIGAAPSQGSPASDATAVVALLHELLSAVPPDVAHARDRAARHRDREREAAPPATPEVRARALADIRARLGAVPPRRRLSPERTRPACSLCDGEGSFFVTREVHLCRRCVDAIATGEARLSATG